MTTEVVSEEPKQPTLAPVAEVGADTPESGTASKPVNAKLAFKNQPVKVVSVSTRGSTGAGFPIVQLSLEVAEEGLDGCPWVPKGISKAIEALQDDAAEVDAGNNSVPLSLGRSWEQQQYNIGCNTLGWVDFDVELVGKPKAKVVGKNDNVKTALSWKVQGVVTEKDELWRLNQLATRSDVHLTSGKAQGDMFE